MKQSSPCGSLGKRVLAVVRKNPGQKARDIARELLTDRKTVNSILYGELRRLVTIDTAFCWWPNDAQSDSGRDGESPEKNRTTQIRLTHATVNNKTRGDDEVERIDGQLDQEHQTWFFDLRRMYFIHASPITASDGEIVAEPLFWFQIDDKVFACFGNEELSLHTKHRLEDCKITPLRPGQNPS